MVAFFAGDAEASAVVVVFFVEPVVLFFLVVVEAAWVVEVVEAVVASSFFVHEPRNAAIVSAVIKAKRDVFIVLVKLNEGRECPVEPFRASTKISLFAS